MRWQGRRQSANVEDRRGSGGGGGGRLVLGGGGGLLLLGIAVVVMFLGGDPSLVLDQLPQEQPQQRQAPQAPGANDDLRDFVSVVLADTEEVWAQQFAQMGKRYVEPKLVLFTGQVNSACGFQSAAVGPFYCPPDQKVYIDLGFYADLKQQLGAPGDFAQAYVIAHEVGHHVQNLLGIADDVNRRSARASKTEANELSVRQELQADFFAGVWAHHAQQNWKILEEGDVEEALNAATAIGDDRLQQRGSGRVVPESFTHGSSEQRARWFYRGLKTGDMTQGDTFSVDYDAL